MRARLLTKHLPLKRPVLSYLVFLYFTLGIFCILMLPSTASAATITAMEYFIDTDPGPGNGTPIPVPPDSGTTVQISLANISTANLTAGTHLLFVRAKDSNGLWGPSRQIRFVMPFAGVGINPVHIDAAEYFFDNDPGEGNGVAIQSPVDGTFDSLRELVAVTGINTSGLVLGSHTLYVRMRGSDGTWGLARSVGSNIIFSSPYNFEVSGLRTIAAMEYFFDTDPGEGNGFSLPIPTVNGTQFNSAVKNISTDVLALGRHTIYIRAKDGDGRWGPPHQHWFEIITTS